MRCNLKRTNIETQIEKDTASSMATLEKIDRIKTELQTAKQGLHEADNWTVLANDVEEVYMKAPMGFFTYFDVIRDNLII